MLNLKVLVMFMMRGKPIKLLNSSFQLLENDKELKKLKLTDLTFNPSDMATSELNTLNLVEVVSPKNTKKYLYALVGIVVILNIAGLLMSHQIIIKLIL